MPDSGHVEALLDERFPGPRPTTSGRHHGWDRLIASVSRTARDKG